MIRVQLMVFLLGEICQVGVVLVESCNHSLPVYKGYGIDKIFFIYCFYVNLIDISLSSLLYWFLLHSSALDRFSLWMQILLLIGPFDTCCHHCCCIFSLAKHEALQACMNMLFITPWLCAYYCPQSSHRRVVVSTCKNHKSRNQCTILPIKISFVSSSLYSNI